MKPFARAIRKTFTYTGRDTRAQFGWFFLTSLVIFFLTGIVDALMTPPAAGKEFSPIALIVMLLMALPTLAAAVRRLHDFNYSGWTMLLGFLPLVNIALPLVLLVHKGTEGANRFGPDPAVAS